MKTSAFLSFISFCQARVSRRTHNSKLKILLQPQCMKGILLLNVLMLSLLSCKKDAPPQPGMYYDYFRRDGLKYLQLNKGEYFIYKDSATGELDSLTVTSSILENLFYTTAYNPGFTGPYDNFTYQFFTLRIKKFDEFTDSIWFEGTAAASIGSSPYHTSDTADILLTEPDQSIAFSYPAFSYADNFLIPSIIIEGKTYTDVIEHVSYNGLNIGDPNYKKNIYYWAKQVGIIKREIITANGHIKAYTLVRNN